MKTKVSSLYPQFLDIDEQHAFLFLISNEDPNILIWTGKFIHSDFVKRRSLQMDLSGSIYKCVMPSEDEVYIS